MDFPNVSEFDLFERNVVDTSWSCYTGGFKSSTNNFSIMSHHSCPTWRMETGRLCRAMLSWDTLLASTICVSILCLFHICIFCLGYDISTLNVLFQNFQNTPLFHECPNNLMWSQAERRRTRRSAWTSWKTSQWTSGMGLWGCATLTLWVLNLRFNNKDLVILHIKQCQRHLSDFRTRWSQVTLRRCLAHWSSSRISWETGSGSLVTRYVSP